MSVADPGFPVGGRRPPTRVLFGGNVCQNERIGSHWRGGGVRAGGTPWIRQCMYIQLDYRLSFKPISFLLETNKP